MGHALIREPGSDPYVRAEPVAVYVSGHDFDNGDINAQAASMINCGFSRGCNWTAGMMTTRWSTTKWCPHARRPVSLLILAAFGQWR